MASGSARTPAGILTASVGAREASEAGAGTNELLWRVIRAGRTVFATSTRWVERPWLPESAVATSPIAPAPVLVVVCRGPRRCPSRRREPEVPRRRQRLGYVPVVAACEVFISGRSWVSTEAASTTDLRMRPRRRGSVGSADRSVRIVRSALPLATATTSTLAVSTHKGNIQAL